MVDCKIVRCTRQIVSFFRVSSSESGKFGASITKVGRDAFCSPQGGQPLLNGMQHHYSHRFVGMLVRQKCTSAESWMSWKNVSEKGRKNARSLSSAYARLWTPCVYESCDDKKLLAAVAGPGHQSGSWTLSVMSGRQGSSRFQQQWFGSRAV